jgi:hypothetical protein
MLTARVSTATTEFSTRHYKANMHVISAIILSASSFLPFLPVTLAAGSDPQSISAFPAYSTLGCATSCFYQYKTVEYFGTILGCTPTAGLLTAAPNSCYCAPAAPTKVVSWLSRCNQQFCGGADPTPAISAYGAYCSANGFPNAAAAGAGSGGGGAVTTTTGAGAPGADATAKPNAAPPGSARRPAVEGVLSIAAGLGLVRLLFVPLYSHLIQWSLLCALLTCRVLYLVYRPHYGSVTRLEERGFIL